MLGVTFTTAATNGVMFAIDPNGTITQINLTDILELRPAPSDSERPSVTLRSGHTIRISRQMFQILAHRLTNAANDARLRLVRRADSDA